MALAMVVFGIVLLRFPGEPSAPWAAAAVFVAIKTVQLALFGSISALERAITRAVDRAERRERPDNPYLVPVEDILNRPDIAGQRRDIAGQRPDIAGQWTDEPAPPPTDAARGADGR